MRVNPRTRLQIAMSMTRTYAIGDIHGLLGKVRRLIARCQHDARGQPLRFVFLGDYIDRGPDSRAVVEHMMELEAHLGDDAVFLKGNHEDMALAASESSVNAGMWLFNGGDATLTSYGVTSARELPEQHLNWFRSLRLTFDDGRRFFVHAGVNAARPLDAQDEHDLLWIREPFLSAARDYGRLVVHGHTPRPDGRPDLRPNRLNIDTGAVFGGALTAAIFDGGTTNPIGFIQVDD